MFYLEKIATYYLSIEQDHVNVYALQAGFSVAKVSVAYEKSNFTAAKTYVNVIAVKEGNENSEGIKELVKALKSDDIKKFINEKYDGAVIPFKD